MSRNGPLALCFHALFVVFMLAPILIVCWVAFTPTGFLSIPVTEFSLRWFRAIASAAGTEKATAKADDSAASQMLDQNACTNSG